MGSFYYTVVQCKTVYSEHEWPGLHFVMSNCSGLSLIEPTTSSWLEPPHSLRLRVLTNVPFPLALLTPAVLLLLLLLPPAISPSPLAPLGADMAATAPADRPLYGDDWPASGSAAATLASPAPPLPLVASSSSSYDSTARHWAGSARQRTCKQHPGSTITAWHRIHRGFGPQTRSCRGAAHYGMLAPPPPRVTWTRKGTIIDQCAYIHLSGISLATTGICADRRGCKTQPMPSRDPPQHPAAPYCAAARPAAW